MNTYASCPICGTWEGPSFGDVPGVTRKVCEDCHDALGEFGVQQALENLRQQEVRHHLYLQEERDRREREEIKACPDCKEPK